VINENMENHMSPTLILKREDKHRRERLDLWPAVARPETIGE
jgi:hypothetical protein